MMVSPGDTMGSQLEKSIAPDPPLMMTIWLFEGILCSDLLSSSSWTAAHQKGMMIACCGLDLTLQVGDHQGSLITQLLVLSRLQNERLSLELQHTDIVALAESVAASFRLNTTRHSILVYGRPSLEILADPLRLEQVLLIYLIMLSGTARMGERSS